MSEQIYHLNKQGQLDSMAEEPFALEATLQELIAEHPQLLSGEQINPRDPRRWILIRREQGVADTEDGKYRWALDHLLIDQDSTPTLVETKRSDNSELRRTVVGQMLDYAAFARRTWKVDDIRQAFEEADNNPDDALSDLLQTEGEPDVDEFWQRVETNLRAARLRLLFVADDIPDELAQVVEFLNEQMPGIEVLAVEIKQFKGEAGETLVPRVIGRTAAIPDGVSKGSRKVMSRDEFFAQMPSPQVRQAAERLLNVAKANGGKVTFRSSGISIRGRCQVWERDITLAWIYPDPNRGWTQTRQFTFGTNDWDMGEYPDDLRVILKGWTDQFKDDEFTRDVSEAGTNTAWMVTYEGAVANIDVLSERLRNVLICLQQLGPLGGNT